MIETRIRAIETYVWSILLYDCEAWTVSREMERRLEAIELWCWRKMLRVRWTERRINANILEAIASRRELLTVLRKRQIAFLGLLISADDLENLTMTGEKADGRGRGRPRKNYLDRVKELIGGVTTQQILNIMSDREQWRSISGNVVNDSPQ